MKTITVETSQLSGAALDWAVAKVVCPKSFGRDWMKGWLSRGSPSADWSQGGPLIDEYDVGLVKMEYGDWCAAAYCTEVSAFNDTGPTPLIAAMRAIVAAKLGDDVEVPTELVEVRDA